MVGLLWWADRLIRLADTRGGLWIDRALLDWLLSHRQPALDRFFLTVTWAGSLYLLIPVTLAVVIALAWRGRVREGALTALSLAGASLLTHAVKLLTARPRPAATELLTPMPLDWSFPSAHTAQITALAVSLALLKTGGWTLWSGAGGLLALGLIAAVGLSRVYLQVHFLSDVIMGALLATLWVLGLMGLNKWLTAV